MMPQKPEYKIIQTKNLSDMETITSEYLSNGWQLAGPVAVSEREECYFHEMIRFPEPDQAAIDKRRQAMEQEMQTAFQQSLDAMDPKIKDLLDINDIELSCVGGKYFTRIGDKIHDGISPNEVLNALKASKHCPLDLDEEAVLQAVEMLV